MWLSILAVVVALASNWGCHSLAIAAGLAPWEVTLNNKVERREEELEQARLAGATEEELAVLKQAQHDGIPLDASPSTREVVTYDLHNVIAERMRAEAGGAVAAGAVSAEKVRLNQHLAGRRATQAAQAVQEATQAVPDLQLGLVGPVANATLAKEEAIQARQVSREAHKEINPSLLSNAKILAVESIEKAAARDAAREAKAYAELAGWDKPVGWANVVSVRAAAPYMKIAGVASQRVAQYSSEALSALDGAQGAVSTAESFAAKAQALQNAGNLQAAAWQWSQAADALDKSKQLQGRFEQYTDVVYNTSNLAGAWRGSAEQAGARAAELYLRLYTPPPVHSDTAPPSPAK